MPLRTQWSWGRAEQRSVVRVLRHVVGREGARGKRRLRAADGHGTPPHGREGGSHGIIEGKVGNSSGRGPVSVATIEEGSLLGPSFFLCRTALRSLALAHRDTYGTARPYPHVVIDGFLGERLASGLAGVFPSASEASWKRRDHPEQAARLGQLQRKAFEGVHGALRHLLSEF